MQTLSEIQRLRTVYQLYAQRKLGTSKWSPANPGNQAALAERARRLGRLLHDSGLCPLTERRILDIGCGTGSMLASFQNWGASPANLVGIDLLPERITIAKQRFPEIAFGPANAEALPFPEASFDLVVLSTVLSSILSRDMMLNIVCQVKRVLCSRGAVVWYDFRCNNPFNRNVRAVSRKEIQELFPEFELRLERATLLPQLARRLGPLTRWLYPPLSSLRVLQTHYLGLLVKP